MDGLVSKSWLHGCHIEIQSIQSGDIQITDAYSTDAEIARYDLVVLEDDKQLFPPYQGAPLMKTVL